MSLEMLGKTSRQSKTGKQVLSHYMSFCYTCSQIKIFDFSGQCFYRKITRISRSLQIPSGNNAVPPTQKGFLLRGPITTAGLACLGTSSPSAPDPHTFHQLGPSCDLRAKNREPQIQRSRNSVSKLFLGASSCILNSSP